ncbi:serine/threonine-protein kinase nekl-2 [Hermetia illucens]|uniref:serine/threonine-protein kinase nekl-2 n=1 Tax=Hermetia illucens TaxID=343691 RepID=UPI0018CC3903|nr:serine/threonine-protein kinase nekl-2 [Hermetia illucens]
MAGEYKYIKALGQGGFGQAYLYQDKNNQQVCIKKIAKTAAIYDAVKSEVYILSQLKHPRIIKFIEVFISNSSIHIVMEYASQGSLGDYLRRRTSPLTTTNVLNIFMDILMGLEYLHIKHVIHRDLKPANLLMSTHNRIKICDFGISAVARKLPNSKSPVGTVHYIAPEILFGNSYDYQADIWSLGCILHELCTMKTPFWHTRDVSTITHIILKSPVPFWNCQNITGSYELRQLCERILTFDPKKRITLPQIIRSPVILPHYYKLYFDYYHENSL